MYKFVESHFGFGDDISFDHRNFLNGMSHDQFVETTKNIRSKRAYAQSSPDYRKIIDELLQTDIYLEMGQHASYRGPAYFGARQVRSFNLTLLIAEVSGNLQRLEKYKEITIKSGREEILTEEIFSIDFGPTIELPFSKKSLENILFKSLPRYLTSIAYHREYEKVSFDLDLQSCIGPQKKLAIKIDDVGLNATYKAVQIPGTLEEQCIFIPGLDDNFINLLKNLVPFVVPSSDRLSPVALLRR